MKYKVRDLAHLLLSLVEGAPQKELPERIEKFADYLKKIRALFLLPGILKEFDKAWNRAHGLVKVEVSAARPLGEARLEEIKKALGAEAEVRAEVNPGLIGGIKILVDDLLIDATLKRRIEDLKNTINT